MDEILKLMQATDIPLAALETVSSSEARVSVSLEQLLPLADFISSRFGGRPELVVAEDHLAASGEFMLRYFFELEREEGIILVSTAVPAEIKEFPSLATRWYQASRFEREIHDLFGIVPVDHPDLRRLPLHQFWPEGVHPLRKQAPAVAPFLEAGTPYPFRRVEGDGIYEITVGPVHAGIIEPSHFRFSVEGETVVNLESRLYFLHKGIEKLFESTRLEDGVRLAERVSGDASVSHGLAFCQAVEALAGIVIPERAAAVRVVLLELERLYNHVADFGGICNDTGFALANVHALRIREDLLRLNHRLVGHRLLRGGLVIGGVTPQWTEEQVRDLQATLKKLIDDFNEVVEIGLSNDMVLDRLQGTGRLTATTAREMQVVGPVARASGINRDVRRDHPFAAYSRLRFQVPVFQEGDVWARAMVRVEEARESVGLIEQALDELPSGALAVPVGEIVPGRSAFGLVEGFRGPVWHWVVAGPNGLPQRVKIKDPSFANWPALNYALLENIVPDFPLINKSFGLSYAGNDL